LSEDPQYYIIHSQYDTIEKINKNTHLSIGRNVKRIKVFIADDHRDFRKVVHEFLDWMPNVSVVSDAINYEETVEKVERLFPDVILMDIAMRLMNGIEAKQVIKQRRPGTKVLIAATHDDLLYHKQALEGWAVGCFLKGS
jgi:DNA-binding NarL/FixJ family response regulator